MPRLLVLLSLVPLAASANAVLIVPQDDGARSAMEGLVEPLSKGGHQLKMAGGRAPAIACLTEKDPKAQQECILEAAIKSNVLGVLRVSSKPVKKLLEVSFELIELGSARVALKETVKAPAATWQKATGGVVKKLQAALTGLKKVEGAAVATVAAKTDDPAPIPAKIETVEVTRVPQSFGPKPTPTPDRPVAVALTPVVKSEPAVTSVTIEAPKSNTAAWAATVVAVGAGGAAAAFGLMGASSKSRLEMSSAGISDLRYTEAVALQSQANQQLSVAGAAGAAAAVAAGLAIFLWSTGS